MVQNFMTSVVHNLEHRMIQSFVHSVVEIGLQFGAKQVVFFAILKKILVLDLNRCIWKAFLLIWLLLQKWSNWKHY